MDGNTNGNWGGNSVTHTSGGNAKEWRQVDLQNTYYVKYIDYYGRSDCCGYRHANLQIKVHSSSHSGTGTPGGIQRGSNLAGQYGLQRRNCNMAQGRYVTLHQSSGSESLNIAEVQVYGVLNNDVFTGWEGAHVDTSELQRITSTGGFQLGNGRCGSLFVKGVSIKALISIGRLL